MLNSVVVVGPVVSVKERGSVVKVVIAGVREFKGNAEETRVEVVVFSRNADAARALREGEIVCVRGRVETKWRESKTGGEWAATDVIADEIRAIAPAAPRPSAPPPNRAPAGKPPADDGWGDGGIPFAWLLPLLALLN
jgi:single-stranded DNA-binding protein